MADIEARYPLSWPEGWQRTPGGRRETGRFSSRSHHRGVTPITLPQAVDRLETELIRLGGKGVVLSTDVKLGVRGMPLSSQSIVKDPGAAVYFTFAKNPAVLACDRYSTVEANVAAIAAHIEAVRAIGRHGVGTIEQMFKGYTALPSPTYAKQWWEVLGLHSSASRSEIEAAYRLKARHCHPDQPGGSEAAMKELNGAVEAARRAVA